MHIDSVFLLDLDGTLVDSVYQHVFAWKEALDAEGINLSVWRIHRKIGMSGGLFTNQLPRETGVEISAGLVERLQQRQPISGGQALSGFCRAQANCCPGCRIRESLGQSQRAGVWRARLPLLELSGSIPKPDPALFIAAAERLGAPIQTAVVVGDSIWDMLAAARCKALGVGVLSGGYGCRELQDAGAIRVYEDPADLLRHIDEIGGRR